MSQISPQVLLRYGRQNQPIRVPIQDLLIDPPAQTQLAADASANSSTITVANTTGFSTNQILLIGDPGNENSEIVYTHASSAPASGVITLSGTTSYAHTASTPVYVLYYDQVQYWSGSTSTAPTSLLGSKNLVADSPTTDWNDTTAASGYYFARFHSTIGSTNSVFSAASPVGGYTILSARAIIDAALGMINKETSPVFTTEYAFQMIDACQMEVLREFKRWSFMQSFNTIIGTTAEGTWKIAVPTDLDDNLTYKSIWNIRIGREYDMVWIDKAEFDALIQGVGYSTVASAALAGATSLVLTSSKDFTSSGSVQVGANVYSFTANDTTTNTLTLGSALLSNVAANQDVFQFASLGLPTYWTIWGGYIYHWPICSSVYAGRNYWMDYYKKLTPTTTDYQEIILPDPTVVQYYLAWKFLLRMNNGEETEASKGFYNNYLLRREKMKQKESTNRNFILSPDLGGDGYYY